MKPTKFLLSVLMAIVMMAMSPTKMWAQNVASVTIGETTTGYDNIQTAVTAAVNADEATLTLLANIDLLGDHITFSNGNVTLDLNGKKLAAQAANDIIVDGGSLTITDNSEGKTGSVPANASSLEVNSGSITIHAGTFSSQYGACLNIQQGVTAKIDGGRFYTTHQYASNAISTNGVAALASGYAYYITGTETQIVPNADGDIPAKDITVKKVEESPAGEDAVSVTINGTTTGYSDFASALDVAKVADVATIKLLKDVPISFTIFDQGNITLDLNGKTIQNPSGSAMSVEGASLTIIDSSEEQNGKVTFTYQYPGSTISAYSGSLTIYAGTFESTKMAALSVGKAYGSDVMPNVKLYGGHFISPTYAIYTEDPNILTSGKAFYDTDDNILTEIDEYGNLLGIDGYSALDVTVKDAPVASVTIDGTTTGYDNIQDAFSAALDAGSATIKILGDVTISSTLVVNKEDCNVTLDLNGKKITSTASLESPVLYLTAGSFSITDSSDDKNGEIKKNSSNLLKVTGGKLTISEGTFTADYFVLDISGEGTASLSGGKYMSTTSSPAIWNDSRKSILANGCAFYITGTNTELFDKADGSIYTPTYAPASNITVMPGTLKATLTIGDVTTDYFDFMTAYNAAINSTSPVTMKMLADVNITPINSGNSLEMANGNVTINLNSHKIYTTNGAIVLLLEGGSLTIDDSSEDKTGTMESSVNNALKVTGGSLRIHGGKFVSAGYSALYVGNGVEDVKIDGGKFIANGSSSAIENYSGKSILVENYAFYNSEGNKDNALAENLNGNILDNGSNVRNITVKKATPKATLTINGETTDYFDFMTAYNVAINSTNPVTMKLLADVNITPINSGNSLEMANGNVTIDLNSHKFSASGGCVWILTGGSLTIDDSSEDKTGTIETNHNSVLSHVGGTLTIHEGKFVSTDSYALDTYGSPNRVISINGGRFIGASTAIFSTKDVLPDGYSYFNAENGMKLSTKSSTYENGQNVSEVIVRANATVINDGAFTCPVSYTPESVTLNRSIVKDGGKYSFIVPFDIPAAKAATLGKFYKFEKYENDVVYFTEETDVKANTAYFFDPASSITSISLNNAEVKATTSMADATNPSGYGLYGTYKKIAVPEGAYGYATSAEGDKFVRAGTESYVNAFRCYLWLGNSDSTPAKTNAIFGFDEATGINATKADYLDLNAPMYNLRGQRITSPQKGEIYIMGGKKVIFK